MKYLDSKVLESFIITTESKTDELMHLSEDKYNNYFLTVKTECVRIIKDMMKSLNNPKVKFVTGVHKIGKFNSYFIGYNEICIGYFQYVTSNEISSFINNFLSTVNEKYSDLISEKLIYFNCKDNISISLYFRKYNTINEKIVPELKNEIDICLSTINKGLKNPIIFIYKENYLYSHLISSYTYDHCIK